MDEVQALADECLADRCDSQDGNGLNIRMVVQQSIYISLFKSHLCTHKLYNLQNIYHSTKPF